MKNQQKTILITGANKGIGFEASRQLLQKGYFVFIGCRTKENGEEAVKELKSEGLESVDYVIINIREDDSVAAAAKEISSKIDYLDGLVNNAGYAGKIPQNASEVSIDLIKDVHETNFYGTIRTTQHFLPLLMKAPQPRIVNVSSDMGSLTLHSDPTYKYYDNKITAYCSSKTVINSYTVMLAYEFMNTKLKVNSISPGFTKTGLNDYKGVNTVEQGARPIVNFITIDENGPTGKFFDENLVELPW